MLSAAAAMASIRVVLPLGFQSVKHALCLQNSQIVKKTKTKMF